MLKPLTFSPTRLAITTVLAVTCLESAQAQSGNWEDYYRNLQRNRQQYLSRERDWYRQRQNEYQSHSVEPRDSYDGRRFVVEDATAAPGYYDVQLPTGETVRMQIQRSEQDGPRLGRWEREDYSQAEKIARELREGLEEVDDRFSRIDHPLSDDIHRVHEQARDLEKQFDRRTAIPEIQQRYAAFDESWHHVVHDLQRSDRVDERLARAIERASEADEDLHRMLNMADGAPRHGYDRPRAALLLNSIVRTLDQLRDDLRRERGRGMAELLRQCERTLSSAQSLQRLVDNGNHLRLLVREYENFDRNLHGFSEAVRGTRVNRRVRDAEGQLSQLDAALHRELRLETPILTTRQQILELAGKIKGDSAELSEEFRYDLRQQRGGIIDLAEDFEREAGQLADRINDHNVRSDLVRNASRAAGESWQRLERALQRTNGITQYTIAEFQQLKSNFELLQRSLNQQR